MDFYRFQDGERKQPDYIIAFRNNGEIMNLEQSQKASREWGEMPIVVIDVDECLKSEKEKADKMYESYKSGDITTEDLRKLCYKIRNNRVTTRNWGKEVFYAEVDLEQMMLELQERENKEKSKNEQGIDEEQLAENYEMVDATERKQGVDAITQIYKQIKEIKQQNSLDIDTK